MRTLETYWDGPYCRAGMYVLFCDADEMRLPVPPGRRFQIDLDEMRTASRAVLTCTGDDLVLTFDDGTRRPFQISFDPGRVERAPLIEDNGREYMLLVWVKGPKEVLRLPLVYEDTRRHASYRPQPLR